MKYNKPCGFHKSDDIKPDKHILVQVERSPGGFSGNCKGFEKMERLVAKTDIDTNESRHLKHVPKPFQKLGESLESPKSQPSSEHGENTSLMKKENVCPNSVIDLTINKSLESFIRHDKNAKASDPVFTQDSKYHYTIANDHQNDSRTKTCLYEVNKDQEIVDTMRMQAKQLKALEEDAKCKNDRIEELVVLNSKLNARVMVLETALALLQEKLHI